MTKEAASTSESRKNSLAGLLIAVGILTIIAGAGGWFMGQTLTQSDPSRSETASKTGDKPRAEIAAIRRGGVVIPLPPVVTNLAMPSDRWVRLEASLVAKPNEDISEALIAEISDDFLNFLRTASMMHLQGGAGLSNLRTDLEERARIRSGGIVEQVLISVLVVE